jgi:hypothetical protein
MINTLSSKPLYAIFEYLSTKQFNVPANQIILYADNKTYTSDS